MEEYLDEIKNKFSSPEEELNFLRQKIKEKEQDIKKIHERPNQDSIIREEIRKYNNTPTDHVLEKGYKMIDPHTKEVVLELTPETHDKKIEEMFSILHHRGLKNALNIIAGLDNPHLEDDFHRFLVQYIKTGSTTELKDTDPVTKALRHTLYEISFPSNSDEEGGNRPLKELLSSMEQLYMGLLSVSDRNADHSFSIEIANPEGSPETTFYISVPDNKKDLFEKQVLSIFPKAKIFEKKDDYNIFNYNGFSVGSCARLSTKPIFPLKTYDKFDYDPLNILLNAFSKIYRDGEGAAFQIVVEPDRGEYLYGFKEALRLLEQGGDIKRVTNVRHSILGGLAKTTKEFTIDTLKDLFRPKDLPKKDYKEVGQYNKEKNAWAIEQIKEKISSPVAHVSLRILASAGTADRAEHILSDIESSFSQYENTEGNKLVWNKIDNKHFYNFVREFAFRSPIKSESLPLSIKELTTILHFPKTEVTSPHVKIARAATAPAPIDLPSKGTLIGANFDRNIHTNIFMLPEDRFRHMYAIGQTGTGKTTLLKNMIIQDIKNGEGVCFIDPHGSDIDDILASVPKNRYKDVIYFDPGHTARPMALNMLEYDPAFPEQKTFVVNELLSIFNKLFDMKVAGGPMFEQYFRNSVQLVMDSPEEGNTLLEVMRVLSSREFRALKLSKCKNPLVVQFWKEIAEKAGGESSLANMVPYITNKFDVFLSNDIMRPIVLQEKSSFNMREIMDNKKIFLVNLSKGRLGDINANLIGLILVGKILMAALSRVDSFGKNMPSFYLYIDEFQNITTNSISQILSEARKYRLSLTIAHQFIAQLEDDIKDAVFGNVGTIASFRVGADDAEYLEKQFSPVFSANDLINIDNRNCCIKLLANGKPLRAFSMATLPPEKGNHNIIPKLKELSYLTFGQEKDIVEDEILNRYKNKPPFISQSETPPFL